MYQKHLNGDPVNSLVMLATFIMILLFNISCVYVPLPAHDLTSQKGVINDELIESLKPGETTRENLLLLLGAPDAQYEQDRYFIYEWEATEGAFAHIGGGGFAVQTHYFCVEFDEDNRIKRFAHFNTSFKSKEDVLIEKKLWLHEAETGLFGYGPIDKLPAIVDEKRSGEVTVIRIRHPFMFAMHYRISLNGTEIFVIRSGQHTKFKLNEGEHYIGVKCYGGWSPGWKHESLNFSVTPNSSYFFKVAPNFSCAGIESITEEEALIKIENSKYVPMNKQRAQIESAGYVVRPKNMPEKASDTPIAAFSPAKVDPTEPWTSEWEVEGFSYFGGTWKMKQTGMIVESTKDSYYEIKGKVMGNQLKGKLKSDGLGIFPIVLNMASDGQSFKGTIETPHRNGLIKGKRKTGQIASADPANFNSAEPWTGKWRVVKGHHTLRGIWAMKQSGTIVKSTKDSYFKFKGKVRGNKLEGKLTGDYNLAHNFVITLSTDGQSFRGVTKSSGFGSGIIRGKRE